MGFGVVGVLIGGGGGRGGWFPILQFVSLLSKNIPRVSHLISLSCLDPRLALIRRPSPFRLAPRTVLLQSSLMTVAPLTHLH